jgi:curved DNA-binding protein CbpA
MSLHYHPDKFQGDPAEAQEKMVLLNEAFRCLKDPAMRRMYEYYEHDYESMVEYEKEVKKKSHVEDLYLYDSSVHILWGRNIEQQFKPLAGLNHTWVLNLYDPKHPDCKRQASEFKTFGRLAERRGTLRAGAINCGFEPGLCQRFWQMVGRRKVPLFMIFPSLQPDENQPTDFEEFNTEEHGWPRAKELERRALRVAAHEVVQVDGTFFEQNITRNPRSRGSVANGTSDERIAIWVVWFYHSAQCSKTEECDRTAPGFRKLSSDLRGIARFAAINCKEFTRSCRGHANGASSVRFFLQRGTKHFVESFTLDHSAYKSGDTTALAGAAQILKLLVQPAVQILYPDHPYRVEMDAAAEGAAAPAGSQAEAANTAAAGGRIDLAKVDPAKLKVAQLKGIIAAHGERCVGCADKSEFVAKVREIAEREATASGGSGGGAASTEL